MDAVRPTGIGLGTTCRPDTSATSNHLAPDPGGSAGGVTPRGKRTSRVSMTELMDAGFLPVLVMEMVPSTTPAVTLAVLVTLMVVGSAALACVSQPAKTT